MAHSSSGASVFCLATLVSEQAIEALLEGGGAGSYRDEHPWLVAAELLERASGQQQKLPILFASKSDDGEVTFSHWSTVNRIDVIELHRAQWESRVDFAQLKPINPIWSEVDSVFVMPSAEQLAREEQENIRVSRTALDEYHIHPYAICETPVFILQELATEDIAE